MTAWRPQFERWLHENSKLSQGSIDHYVGAIKSILSWVGMEFSDIISLDKFKEFEKVALSNNTFLLRDSTANKMYSSALRYLKNFVDAKFSDESRIYPEVIENSSLIEGGKKQIIVNAYERNPYARKACIEHYGAKCVVCGFDFSKVYGEDFIGVIHVHHIKPLCEVSEEYIVDPVNDLVPVCPNCHVVIHSKSNGVYTIEEVKKRLEHNKD